MIPGTAGFGQAFGASPGKYLMRRDFGGVEHGTPSVHSVHPGIYSEGVAAVAARRLE